eukprot:TRINITY_DN12311_c0_g1_i1.p1 TRINITY_DN12311_c0_g1~~TRINITY_DN12311_c0_g1_i1.p1  ORF type:complete len:420 (-),score=108.87 TRINITY_DN12311_c0_g1_i1:66-1280(-)
MASPTPTTTTIPFKDYVTSIDVAFVTEALQKSGALPEGVTVTEVSFEEELVKGGLAALLHRFHVKYSPESPTLPSSYIVKTLKEGGEGTSKGYGFPREAKFYNTFSEKLAPILPKIIYSAGEFETGIYLVIMEDLSTKCSQAGQYFDPNQPMNAGLKPLTKEEEVPQIKIAKECFSAVADFHASYFMDKEALKMTWVRGAPWVEGKEEADWNQASAYLKAQWAKIQEGLATTGVKWSDSLLAICEASLGKSDFQSYVQEYKDFPWALIHGDFHPANIMWDKTAEDGKHVRLIDWQVVTVRAPSSDLGQFLISHMTPENRRACEKELVQHYHDALISKGVSAEAYPFDLCWSRYRMTGFRRWMFLLILIGGMGVPDGMMQYFHDQVAAFAIDHKITPEEVGQPFI